MYSGVKAMINAEKKYSDEAAAIVAAEKAAADEAAVKAAAN